MSKLSHRGIVILPDNDHVAALRLSGDEQGNEVPVVSVYGLQEAEMLGLIQIREMEEVRLVFAGRLACQSQLHGQEETEQGGRER